MDLDGPDTTGLQSMNLFVQDPDYARLTSMHFYAWKRGLKTGMYYLRTRPAADAIPFTLDPPSAPGRTRVAGSHSEEVASGTGEAAASRPGDEDSHGDICISCQG